MKPPITASKLFYQTEAAVFETKSAKEPHYYAGKEQDRTSLDDEAFQSFPYMKQYGLSLRNMVLRKLHNERSRLSGERFGFL